MEMIDAIGEPALRWTVRVAMLLYVGSWALTGIARGDRRWLMASRVVWTAACLAYLAHVACAFQFVHHWSHADAYASTARQTHAVAGIDWGGGLFANYAFTIVWLADVCWWWTGIERYQSRSRPIAWLVQAYLAFIVFNATVVFAAGPIRWAGIVACVLFAAIFATTLRTVSSFTGRSS